MRPAAGAERGADFDFLDHELMVAGGYGLAAAAEREADSYFLDHELMYAGGYALRPAARVERGADFDFIDRELKYAGGYGLVCSGPGVLLPVVDHNNQAVNIRGFGLGGPGVGFFRAIDRFRTQIQFDAQRLGSLFQLPCVFAARCFSIPDGPRPTHPVILFPANKGCLECGHIL